MDLHSFLTHVDWVILGPIFAVALAPIILRWPVESSLGLYAFLVPFDDVAMIGSGHTGPTLTKFVGGGAALIAVVVGLVERRLTRPPRAAMWLTLFIVWAGITSLWSLDTQDAYSRVATAGALLVVYLAAVCLRVTEKEFRAVVWLAILGACAAAGYGVHAFHRGTIYVGPAGYGGHVGRGSEIRGSLILGAQEADPDVFGDLLLTPLSLAVGLLLADRSWLRRGLWISAVALIAFAVFATMSRGAVVALIAMLLVYLYRYRMSWRAWVPIGVMGAMLSMVPETFFSRVGKSYSTGGAGRLDIWTVGLHGLQRYGLAGAGLESFPYVYGQYIGYAPNYLGRELRGSHNIYLGMAVELGILGLILMIAAFASHFGAARRSSRTAGSESPPPPLTPYEAACWGLLVAAFFQDIIWRKAFWLAWILLAIAVRLREDGQAAYRL